ncbi:MAG TPA: polysaccharide deacetylase family protein [Chitinophagaceae bacterium]|nr:polysaccharide deacetylase family protein [Chitinophagaceae bacterium]
MLLIYTPDVSSRFAYTADVLFSQASNNAFTITTGKDEFLSFTGAKINYSNQPLRNDELWVQPHGLLFEHDIKPQVIDVFEWNNLKAFFKTGGDAGFDVFAAAFYLVSRYEEYLPHAKDEYGRYAHTNSIAFKERFLHVPLVNLWLKELAKMMEGKFPSFTFHFLSFNFTPTYDIDIAYAYKGKGFKRNAGALARAIKEGRPGDIAEWLDAASGFGEDPFDTYRWLDNYHNHYKLKPIYFFLLAQQPGLYDKNISPEKPIMRRLIKKHAEKYETGIHPSWQSGDDETLLAQEIGMLQSITGSKVMRSRQHYIRMQLPGIYRVLLKYGIIEDYTMGYGSINGFRASVATPFYWYDLEKEEKTGLLLRPYCYMEANSYFEQHYTAEQATDELQQYHDIVKAVSGQLITIFHNHFITQQQQWQPWKYMYAAFLQQNL